jgi:hypothetical protein
VPASGTKQGAATSAVYVHVYVYGVVRSGALRKIKAEGVGGAAVEQVERDDLAALTSALPTTELRVKRRDLHRHLQVLEEVFETTTVLPCPVATVAATDELADGLLVERREELLSALERLDDKVQMNVKAAYVENELLREIVETEPDVARLRESTKAVGDAGYYAQLQLGELVAAAVGGRRERDGDRLLRELAGTAADVAVEDRQDTAFKASFLVPRAGLRRFEETLETIAHREQPLLQFEVIGPLPPTAFASAYAGV